MSLNLSGALSKEQRDALPDSEFAVPGKRLLPIHDETHVRMAWKMVDKTKGLSPEERSTAKNRIVKRANKLGINTDDWNIKAEAGDTDTDTETEDQGIDDDQDDSTKEVKAHSATIQFSGMALDFPEDKEHPNKVPFNGILTRIDEPSDNPLSGSSGKRVVLPKDVAESALGSLLGMAIDFTKELDGHDAKSKIGFITEANIEGNAIHISGYFYGADFPDEVKHIQAEKASLGFSYEAQAQVRSMNDDPLVIKSCVFTGAAVLYKDKAAYTSTSLSANMEKEKMNEDKLLKMIEDLHSKIAILEAASAEKNSEDHRFAAGNIQHIIKPHAEALRNCAASMAAAGVGMHPKNGHVSILHNMADNMEAEAVLGKMPHVYQTNDFLYASADKSSEPSKEVTELKAGIDAINSKLTDLEKAKFNAAASPERKTLTPSILALLAKSGIKTSDGEKMKVNELDEILAKTKIKTADKIAMKLALKDAGNL